MLGASLAARNRFIEIISDCEKPASEIRKIVVATND